MLNQIRLVVTLAAVVLTAGGYFASQARYFSYQNTGDPSNMIDYLTKLDNSPVPLLSLILIVAAVVLCCIPEKTEGAAE